MILRRRRRLSVCECDQYKRDIVNLLREWQIHASQQGNPKNKKSENIHFMRNVVLVLPSDF